MYALHTVHELHTVYTVSVPLYTVYGSVDSVCNAHHADTVYNVCRVYRIYGALIKSRKLSGELGTAQENKIGHERAQLCKLVLSKAKRELDV